MARRRCPRRSTVGGRSGVSVRGCDVDAMGGRTMLTAEQIKDMPPGPDRFAAIVERVRARKAAVDACVAGGVRFLLCTGGTGGAEMLFLIHTDSIKARRWRVTRFAGTADGIRAIDHAEAVDFAAAVGRASDAGANIALAVTVDPWSVDEELAAMVTHAVVDSAPRVVIIRSETETP
jgi:hypothetical protein